MGTKKQSQKFFSGPLAALRYVVFDSPADEKILNILNPEGDETILYVEHEEIKQTSCVISKDNQPSILDAILDVVRECCHTKSHSVLVCHDDCETCEYDDKKLIVFLNALVEKGLICFEPDSDKKDSSEGEN